MDCNIIFQQKYHKLVWLSVFEWVLQWLKLVESIILLLDYFYNTVKSSGIVFVIVQFTENWKRLSDLQNNSYVELLHNFKKILSKHLSVNISRSAEILMEILHLIMETKTTPSRQCLWFIWRCFNLKKKTCWYIGSNFKWFNLQYQAHRGICCMWIFTHKNIQVFKHHVQRWC